MCAAARASAEDLWMTSTTSTHEILLVAVAQLRRQRSRAARDPEVAHAPSEISVADEPVVC